MSYKVIIELDFDTYKPKAKDIVEYVNELGENIGYELINNSKKNSLETFLGIEGRAEKQ